MSIYSVHGHGVMVADRNRTDTYIEAMRRSVKPGALVLDLGAGSGLFSLVACQLGARKVVAVEPDEIIQVARAIATDCGYADRIEFIQACSTQISLPEGADVIVSDLRGVLPFFGSHLGSLADARRRLLAPGGILIPREDTVWVALVESPDLYRTHVGPWEDNEFGLDMRAALNFSTNGWCKARFRPEQLLAKPQCWTRLDYTDLEETDARGEVALTMSRTGTAHGLCVWFDATLVEGVGFSNAPGASEQVYAQAFFPLTRPLVLKTGDVVSVALRADRVGDDYQWTWETRAADPNEPVWERSVFKQSTFLGSPRSLERLRKRCADHVPSRLTEDGQIVWLILERMQNAMPLGAIARELLERFPKRFPRWEAALGHVGELSERYGQ